MNDPIFNSWLRDSVARGAALAAASDILDLWTDGSELPQRFVARFDCRSLIKMPDSEPRIVSGQFEFGIRFPDDYLREFEPQIVTVFRPWSLFHPNITWGGPYICLGKLSGGTPLDDILFQIYEIISYQKWSAHDGLNDEACEYARAHQELFPLDRRPLKRKEVKP